MRSLVLAVTLSAVLALQPTDSIADFRDYVSQVNEAIAQGNGELAMDLICDLFDHNVVKGIAEVGEEEMLAFMASCTAFEHRRYDEVFEPPPNVEDLFAAIDFEDPRFDGSWSTFGFTASVFSIDPSERDCVAIPEEEPYSITVDLDLDGHPEIAFDGTEPTISEDMSVAEDHSSDGSRAQWFVSPTGVDPRVRPFAWLYRDGPAAFIIVDTDGDGKAGFARSLCFE